MAENSKKTGERKNSQTLSGARPLSGAHTPLYVTGANARPLSGTHPPLYVIGAIAQQGSRLLLQEKTEELSHTLPAWYLKRAAATHPLSEELVARVQETALQVRRVEQEGFFEALWYFGEELRAGMKVQLRAVPVYQETVEICERLEQNPYELACTDCLLAAGAEGAYYKELAEAEGILCACIGFLQPEKARILENGEEIRYLDKPRKGLA